jgi:hypothetical protein
MEQVSIALIANFAIVIISSMAFKNHQLLHAIFFGQVATDLIVVSIAIAGWQVVFQNMHFDRELSADSSSITSQIGTTDTLSDETLVEMFKILVCLVVAYVCSDLRPTC